MCSSRSDAERFRPVRLAAALFACLWPLSSVFGAAFHVRVSYIDPNGAHLTVDGTDAVYTFLRRSYSRRRATDGTTAYEDKVVRERAFPFASRRIPFRSIRSVTFERANGSGEKPLVLRFEMAARDDCEFPASEMEGAEHPISPALVFHTESGPMSIPLDPLASASGRSGRPVLERLEFPENPDSRRQPRGRRAGAGKTTTRRHRPAPNQAP